MMSGRPTLTRRVAATCAAVAAVAAVSGCGAEPPAPPPPEPLSCGSPGRFAVAIAARANSPAMNLPDNVADRLTQSARAGHQIVVVRADGEPAVVFDEALNSTAGNGPAFEADLGLFLDDVRAAFGEPVRAVVGEADPLMALDRAGRSAGEGGTVVLIDSGIQTVAPLRFQDHDGSLLDSATPAETVEYLKKTGGLPTLAGRAVVLAGLGEVAAPQEPLSNRQRDNVVQIWKAMAEAAGASCVEVIDMTAPEGSEVADAPAVAVVPVPQPPPPPAPCGETVLTEGNGVGFLPDSDRFRDEPAAREAIGRVADQMRSGRQRAEIVGTTANHGPIDGQIALSRLRAEAVRQVLADMGIDPSRISTTGVGSRHPGHIPDGGPNGPLLPGPAAANRTVVVTLFCG